MPAKIIRLLRRALCATLLVAAAPPLLHAHQPEPASLQSPASAVIEVTGTGTVAELVVDNQITHVTLRYLALHLDDGHTVALTGAGLDSLANGARLQATRPTRRKYADSDEFSRPARDASYAENRPRGA